MIVAEHGVARRPSRRLRSVGCGQGRVGSDAGGFDGEAAIEAGADYLVVGRPIVKAKPGKRLAEAEAIIAEMTEALEEMKEAAG